MTKHTLLVVALVAAGCSATQAQLAAQTKVSKTDAEKVALAQTHNGKIQHSELERENGKLVWSFDIETPGTKDITEVQIDAVTGAVAAVEKENPDQQAEEKRQDAAEKK